MKNSTKAKPYRLPPLFILPELEPSVTGAEITGEEASHALRSRRLRAGDDIDLTNGHGLIASAEITSVRSRPDILEVAIRPPVEIAAATPPVVLASALPKGERLSTMLDMATQLGMDRFVPLECDFSVVPYRPKMQDRWMRIIASACKQSRRVWHPGIGQGISPQKLEQEVSANNLVVYGDHNRREELDPAGIPQPVQQITVIVGPEGGFSDRELLHLEQSPRAHGVSIGCHILRTETAAVAMLSYANLLRQQIASASVRPPRK